MILVGALAGLIVGGGVVTAVVVLGKDDSKPAQAAAQRSAFSHAPEEEGIASGDAGENSQLDSPVGGGKTMASAEGCERVDAPSPKEVSFEQPGQVAKRGERVTAVVETSCGTFQIALDAQRAPRTVNSFAFLAEEGFYDRLTFHRVAPGFVIQGGDPRSDGTGGPGYSVDEEPPANLAYTKGVVAMAKSSTEPTGRSGSQFFIVLAANAGLPPEYALVGKVSEGMAVVEQIGELGTPAEKPKQTVLIERISIRKG